MKKYYIQLVSIDNSEGQTLYTYNVYKRVFFRLFWVSIYTFTDSDRDRAYYECEKYVKNIDGEPIDCDD